MPAAWLLGTTHMLKRRSSALIAYTFTLAGVLDAIAGV